MQRAAALINACVHTNMVINSDKDIEILSILRGIHSPSKYQFFIHGLRATFLIAIAILLLIHFPSGNTLGVIFVLSFSGIAFLIAYLDIQYISSSFNITSDKISCSTKLPVKGWSICTNDIRSIEIEKMFGGKNLKINYGANKSKRILLTRSMEALITKNA